jgi:hypothetical protein
LNAAGIESASFGKHVDLKHAFSPDASCGVFSDSKVLRQADRRRLLHAANDPDASPEWRTLVRKALGVSA